jgi:hypothetical protein
MSYLAIFLYGLLGMLLALSGVSVTDKPVHFIAIMLVVLIIDYSAYKSGLLVYRN